MAEYIVQRLIRKRAALAAEIFQAQSAVPELALDLGAVDDVLKALAPDLDVAAIAPRMRKWGEHSSRRGEMKQHVLAILRSTQNPLSSREIAAQLITRRGLAGTDELLNLMKRRVAACLRACHEQGLVDCAPASAGRHLIWRIA